MRQMNDKAAKQLNALEKRLTAAKEKLDAAQGDYDRAFALVWAIFDQELGAGAPARFICEDGFLVGRQVPRPTQTIDAAKLIALVNQHVGGLKAKRLLGRVIRYEPVAVQKKVAEEVEKGRLDVKLVRQFVSEKANSPRRERHPASKQDQQSLAAGILESPQWSDEEVG